MLVGGFIPFIGTILPLVGLILLFVAVKYLADETKDETIFKNYVLYFVCTIIAFIAVIAVIVIVIGGSLSWLAFLESKDFTEPGNNKWGIPFIGAFCGGMAIALVIGWVLLIIGTMYLRKSYNHIAKHTKIDLFRTTGTMYFIGAITLIILIGGLILFIAKILEIVSFFSLPETLPAIPTEVPESGEG